MKTSYTFLTVNGLVRVSAGALPPLLALLVMQSLSIQVLATCMVAAAVVRFLLTPVLAPFVDRSDPLLLLFKCEAAFALLSAITAWNLWFGSVAVSYWVLFFMGSAVIHSIEGTAYPKVTLKLVDNEKLTVFIGWESAVMYSVRLVGPLLAGFCLLVWSAEKALLGFLLLPPLLTVPVYAVMWLRLADRFRVVGVQAPSPKHFLREKLRLWFHDVMSGFYARWAIATERYLAIQVFFELLIIIPTFGILLPRVITERHWDNSWLGWMEAGSGAGLVLGSALAPRVMKLCGQWLVCVGSAVGLSLGVAACGIFIAMNESLLLTAALFFSNASLALRMQAGAAQRRVAVPDRMRARFGGAHFALNALAAQIGVITAVTWLSYFSSAAWFALGATGLLMLAVGLAFVPGYRALVSMEVAAATGFYEKQYPMAFHET